MKYLKKLYKYKCVLILILFSGYFPILLSQDLSTELHLKLSGSDQGKISKSDELYNKGLQSESESNQYPSGERKAQMKRLEAADFYQRSISAKSKVYRNNIKSFWKNFTGNKAELDYLKKYETAAFDSLKIASGVRNKAEDQDKLDQKIVLLKKAEKIELTALLRLQKVLYAYLNLPVHYDESWISSEAGTIPQSPVKENPEHTSVELKDTVSDAKKKTEETFKNDSSLYELVEVNEEQIDMFNEFLKKTYPAEVENYVIDFSKLNYSDINQIKQAWFQYQFDVSDSIKSEIYPADSGTLKNPLKESLIASTQNPVPDPDKNSKTDLTKQDTTYSGQIKQEHSGKSDKKDYASDEVLTSGILDKERTKESGAGTGKKNVTTENTERIVNSDKFIYRVQIAACRIALDERNLHDIYDGPEQILELEEDLWFKYAIGEFDTYKAARLFANDSKIPGAFVISYLNGKRIKITPASGPVFSAVNRNINPEEIEFRIQIAASKSELSDELLANIYEDTQSIKMIREEGWYKYSVQGGKNIEETRSLVKKLNIPGAFVVAYHNNIKIELSEAIKLTTN